MFRLHVEMLDEQSEVTEPGVMLEIANSKLLAEAAKSYREHDDFIGELKKILRKK